MLDIPPVKPVRSSHNLPGLIAILLSVLCWAIAANVVFDLFRAGIQPLELAGASAMIATFVWQFSIVYADGDRLNP